MTVHPDHLASAANQQIIGRCRVLGLPVWTFHGGRQRNGPIGWEGGVEPFLTSARLRCDVSKVVNGYAGTDTVLFNLPFAGCRLACYGYYLADMSHVVTAALVASPELADDAIVAAICEEESLSCEKVRESVRTLPTFDADGAERIRQILQWMASDRHENAEHSRAVANFSVQLVDIYEHMSLLYRVGELMSGLDDPRGFVRTLCDLLQTTLDFEWVGVRFSSLHRLGPSMVNDLVLAGEPPCSHTRYDRLAGELALNAPVDMRPTVLDPNDQPLANLVGAEVFVNPLICAKELAGLLIAGNKKSDDPAISSVDMQLLSATADYLSAYLHNAAMYNEQRATFLGIIKALTASMDAKDPYTRGHSERVAYLAGRLASAAGMVDEQVERVRLAGMLHDLGKIGVPEAVLLKPGKLTDEEFEAIKLHPTIGYNILKDIEPLQDILPGVLYHHERWDGRGYPQGLKAEQIPLLGRILAVADSFDAMSSNRAYRPRMARDAVFREMERGKGMQWDKELIRMFLELDFGKYDAMIERHASQDALAA